MASAELSTRAKNILKAADLPIDPGIVREKILSGFELLRVKNCGFLTWREIYRWAGLNPGRASNFFEAFDRDWRVRRQAASKALMPKKTDGVK